MNAPPQADTSAFDRSAAWRATVYRFLIAISVLLMIERIATVNLLGQFHWLQGTNDRSRWDTVRALVERGTYAVDEILDEPGWGSVDIVQHRGADGQLH